VIVRADASNSPRWTRLSEIIAARTGLHFPPERRADLQRALGEAAPEFGIAGSDAFADWLLSAPLSTRELSKLAQHLTIGETYFFRERPSFDALASQVLPGLIQRNRDRGRRLRLWSAACSSGEEAYSLAMLLQQVLPDWRDWKITILASDINPRVLRKAEAGVYGEWSFRDCPADLRERFFTPCADRRFRVREDLRSMVTFAELNLSQDNFAALANDTNAMDLILCRNLLIYFTAAHARQLVGNLRHCLVDEGWLIVSPSECSQALFAGFAPVNFPGSILYRKTESRAVAQTPMPLGEGGVSTLLRVPPTHTPVFAPVSPPLPDAGVTSPVARAEALYAQGRYADAAALLRATLAGTREGAEALPVLALLTRALANQGLLDDARGVNERWLAADKLDPAAHYLNAMVLQELGERSLSRASLQRAVYLQPDFTLAHFALGNQARAEARPDEARRHFDNAARLLRGLAADEALAESDGLSAGRLREIIDALTSNEDS
jgi:chemotaxis protein methyltransferase CheR